MTFSHPHLLCTTEWEDELGRELAIVQFKLLFKHLLGKAEETTDKL